MIYSKQIYSSIDKKLFLFDTNNLPIPENTYLYKKLNERTFSFNNIEIDNVNYPVFDYPINVLRKILNYIAHDISEFGMITKNMYNCLCSTYSCVCECQFVFTLGIIQAFDFLLLIPPSKDIVQSYDDEMNAKIEYEKLWLFLVLTFDKRTQCLHVDGYDVKCIHEYRHYVINHLGAYVYEIGRSALKRLNYGSSNIVEVYLDKDDNLNFTERVDFLIERVFGKKKCELDVYKNIKNNILHVYIGNTELSTYSNGLFVHLNKVKDCDIYNILLNYSENERVYINDGSMYGTVLCKHKCMRKNNDTDFSLYFFQPYDIEDKFYHFAGDEKIIKILKQQQIISINICCRQVEELLYSVNIYTDVLPYRFYFSPYGLVSNDKNDYLSDKFYLEINVESESEIETDINYFGWEFLNVFFDSVF